MTARLHPVQYLSILVALTLASGIENEASAQRFPFVIPGDDAAETATDFSHLSPSPAGADGFVRVQDGHFVNDSARVRLWGVNVGYGACFPSHEDAERVAAHFAKLGINAVRIHHHESQPSPTGLLLTDGSFDPKQVDRLDFFLAQLHKHGIYANLNLHVGRVFSRELNLPQLGNSFDTHDDKHSLHFQPEIQAAFRKFCREYLTHRNPYRGMRRVDDPAIAMIELCNENSFTRAGSSLIRSAPEPYRTAIKQRWNQWLKNRYPNQTTEQAWRLKSASESHSLTDSTSWHKEGLGGWEAINANPHAPISLKKRQHEKQAVVRLVPEGEVAEAWHQQFASGMLSLQADDNYYTLQFDCRADEKRSADLHVSTSQSGNWEPLGLVKTLQLEPKWQTFVFRFRATRKVKDAARTTFSLGGNTTPVELRALSFRTGIGQWQLPQGQSFARGNVDLPADSWPPPANDDVWHFMVNTETQFYAETKKFLQKELGVRVPMLTTQVDYQQLKISSSISDFQDMHVYWHHPEFPEQDWDPHKWTVQNETLLAYPFNNDWPRVNLTMRAGWRVHGQPFTISEWNTGEPNFFSADAIPMAAVMASLQDWDAVFFFDYHNRRDLWNADHIQNFFEINGQPCKKALLGPMANLYRRGDLAALDKSTSSTFGQHESLGPLSLRYRIGIDPQLSSNSNPESLNKEAADVRRARLLTTPNHSVRWDAREPNEAHAVIDTPNTKCVWGLVGGRSMSVGSWRMDFGKTERDYAVLVATSRDGARLDESKSILLVALANAENTGMQWNDDRTSVGANWGEGPTMVNGVPLQITIPAGQKAKKVFALDARGNRMREVHGKITEDGSVSLSLGPEFKTLWYEITADE
jgi:hypothetical protein